MNPFEMHVGLGSVPEQPAQSSAPPIPPTAANPFPGSGITIAQGPTDPAFAAQQDREEAAGANNLMNVWKQHDELRAAADMALSQMRAGRMSMEDAANVIMRYQDFRDKNAKMLEQRPVNQGNPFWNFIFGGRR